jgi:hypothetical protein
MASAFHVDRIGGLQAGERLGLFMPWTDALADPTLQHVAQLFPTGVTRHGWGYLLSDTLVFPPRLAGCDEAALAAMRNHAIELLYEYVRRAEFGDRPSRFQSVFAWESLQDAQRFVAASGAAAPTIWRLEGTITFRADINLVTLAGSMRTTSEAAHRYWRGAGDPTRTPHWECFLAPGALVTERID